VRRALEDLTALVLAYVLGRVNVKLLVGIDRDNNLADVGIDTIFLKTKLQVLHELLDVDLFKKHEITDAILFAFESRHVKQISLKAKDEISGLLFFLHEERRKSFFLFFTKLMENKQTFSE